MARQIPVSDVVAPWLSFFVGSFGAIGMFWGLVGSLAVPELPGGVLVATLAAMSIGAIVGFVVGAVVAAAGVWVAERDAGRGAPAASHVAAMRTVVLVATAPLLLTLAHPLLVFVFLLPNAAAIVIAYQMTPRILGTYYRHTSVRS